MFKCCCPTDCKVPFIDCGSPYLISQYSLFLKGTGQQSLWVCNCQGSRSWTVAASRHPVKKVATMESSAVVCSIQSCFAALDPEFRMTMPSDFSKIRKNCIEIIHRAVFVCACNVPVCYYATTMFILVRKQKERNFSIVYSK